MGQMWECLSKRVMSLGDTPRSLAAVTVRLSRKGYHMTSVKDDEESRMLSKWKIALAGIVGVVALAGLGSAFGSGGADTSTSASAPATYPVETVEQDPIDETPTYPVETVEQAPVDEAPSSSSETSSQENARESAQNYLDTMAFSRKGLIEQLSSDAGDGFPRADAIYAVNHVDVDWYEQAAKSAQNYLDTMAFSRSGLIEQLESDAGDGYTHAQAVYGVAQAY
jgi:hypothetical protein